MTEAMKTPFVLAAVAALAGCAAAPAGRQVAADARAALEVAPLCCKSLDGARRQPLPVAAPVEVVIDTGAQAFDFGGNKAYFVLYELPPFERPYSVRLTSHADGPLNDAALLIPRVAMYDAHFKPLRFFDEKTLRNRGNNLERTVFVNPANAGERFLAIYGSDMNASIERAYSMVTVTPVVAGPVIFNMVSGQDGVSKLHSAPVGKLTIEVLGLQPPPAPKR